MSLKLGSSAITKAYIGSVEVTKAYLGGDVVFVTVPIINVTSVSVAPASISITDSETTQLTETVLPVDATDKSGVWSSSDETKATVSASGLVTGVAVGSATITFTTTDGGFTDTSVITVTATSSIPLANILSEYKFENNVLDTVGANDGTATDITYLAGLVGQTGKFNGTSSYVDLGTKTLFGGKTSVSISFLYKSDVFSPLTTTILYGAWTAPLDDRALIIRVVPSQGLQFYTYTADGQVGGQISSAYGITSWQHFVLTYDGAFMRCYKNGVKSATELAQTGAIQIPTTTNERIGDDGGQDGFGDCRMDCVRIWDITLNDAQALEIATAELAGTDINP